MGNSARHVHILFYVTGYAVLLRCHRWKKSIKQGSLCNNKDLKSCFLAHALMRTFKRFEGESCAKHLYGKHQPDNLF